MSTAVLCGMLVDICIHLLIFSASLVDIGHPREFSSDFSRQVFGKLKSDDNSNTFLGGSDSYGNVHGKSFGNSYKGKRIRDQRYSRLSLNSLDDLSAILDNLHKSRTIPNTNDLFEIQQISSSKTDPSFQQQLLDVNTTSNCNTEYRKIDWLKEVNVSSFSFQAKKQQIKFIKISKKQARRTKQWLASRLTCSTEYSWRDMGQFVYPRYLRFGKCGNTVKSCSLPPGMFCKPETFKDLTMHVFAPSTKRSCRYKRQSRNKNPSVVTRQGRKKKNRCRSRWFAMDYQIVESCACQC